MVIKNEILLSVILILLVPFGSFAQEWEKNIASGIKYKHIKTIENSNPLHIHILKVDLNNNKIDIKPELAKDRIGGLERTSSIAERNNAIAAINGSFFAAKKKDHLPVGFMVIDGRIVNKSILDRTAIGIKPNKEIVFGIPKTKGYAVNLNNGKSVSIWGINRPRKNDEVIVYTSEYGRSTKTNDFGKEITVDSNGTVVAINISGDSPIPSNGFIVSLHGWSRDFSKKIKVGDKVRLVYDLADEWKDVKHALTGGPLLIKNGEIVNKESLINEKFTGKLLPPNSRTAIGVTRSNELLLVVVDKSGHLSSGVTYDELANIMKEAGAYNAMGLDGGHASTMYVNGKVVNYPLTGYENEISNALVVTYDGWKLAAKTKPRTTTVIAYKPPSKELVEAIKELSELQPSSYSPRPEDLGIFGLSDLYSGTVKPIYFFAD